MPRHPLGPFIVEVLHRQDKQNVKVSIFVFQKGEHVEQAEFAFNAFNSLELRRELPALARFDVQKLGAVIEDARGWPKDGNGKTAKAKTRRSSRKTEP